MMHLLSYVLNVCIREQLNGWAVILEYGWNIILCPSFICLFVALLFIYLFVLPSYYKKTLHNVGILIHISSPCGYTLFTQILGMIYPFTFCLIYVATHFFIFLLLFYLIHFITHVYSFSGLFKHLQKCIPGTVENLPGTQKWWAIFHFLFHQTSQAV